jgi:hypothetical protein
MAFDSIFPFLPAGATSPPQLFPYDIIINTAFPGIEFIGTEPNALYQEIREVNGCLWIVTNAMYNENLLQWDQETNQNTTLPAYALELCDGAMTRFYSPATLIPMTPITWTPLWTVTADGLMDSTPLEITGPSAPMNQLQVTWDPGVGIAPVAREVDITDIASSPNSLLDNLVVNGVQEWTVNKEGVLIHGTVPGSAVIGPFNNATFNGTSTFTGPTTFTTGPVTDDGTLYVAGLTTLNGGADINGGETVTGGSFITGGVSVDSLTDTGPLTVDGPATFNGSTTFSGPNLTVTGNLIVDGTSTLDGTVANGSGGPVVPISSPDASISVVTVGNGYHIETAAAPIAPGSTYVNTAFYGLGSTSGTISIGPLPGTAANSFRIICWGALQFHDASHTLTLTGVVAAGVTWDVASQGYENANSGTFPYMYFGTAEGGTTPTINWSSDDPVDFTPMFMTIMASIQL